MRHHLVKFLDDLVAYLSYDVVESSFNRNIVDKFFHNNDNELVLDELFMEFPEKDTDSSLKVNKLSIDELISVHDTYLDDIVYTKIFNGSAKGAKTNISFIDQIYEILQSIFRFINTSQEYLSVVEMFLILINSRDSIEGQIKRRNISWRGILMKYQIEWLNCGRRLRLKYSMANINHYLMASKKI